MHKLTYTHKGKVWTTKKIFNEGRKSRAWCATNFKKVIDGERSIEDVLIDSIKKGKTESKYSVSHDERIWTVKSIAQYTGMGVAWATTKMRAIAVGTEKIENVLIENIKTSYSTIKVAYNGKMWTPLILHEYASNKALRWCSFNLRKVANKKMRMDVLLKIARTEKRGTKYVFIGNATKNHPGGKIYTPWDVVKKVSKKGKPIRYETACARIRRAMKDHRLEKEILRPKAGGQAMDVSNYYKDELSPRRQKAWEKLKLCANHNQLLEG